MTRSEIEHARALAETYAPKSTDPLRDATQARSTIELLPRLTLKLLDEREALLEALVEVIYDNRPGGGAEDRARRVLDKVRAP